MIHSVLGLVGATPVLSLGAQDGAGEVVLKLEGTNPSGSVKDRAVLAIIDDGLRRGALRAGETIVEASSGNTATSLAVIGPAKGCRVAIVAPGDLPGSRRAHLEALGVELILTDPRRRMSGALERVEQMARNGAFVLRQFSNPAGAHAHAGTADELIEQCEGRIDAFVAGVGTGATITGCGRRLRERIPSVRVVAVEPAESAVLSGGRPAPHQIPGIGAGSVPPLLDQDLIDEVYPVPSWEALEAVRELGRLAGLFCGPSTGAVLMAARSVARRLGPGSRTAGISADWGERNLGSYAANAPRL